MQMCSVKAIKQKGWYYCCWLFSIAGSIGSVEKYFYTENLQGLFRALKIAKKKMPSVSAFTFKYMLEFTTLFKQIHFIVCLKDLLLGNF